MDDEWLAAWNRERKGKQKALDPDSEADAELEARVLSHMWDVPTDLINKRSPKYAELLSLLDDELEYVKSDGTGDADEQDLDRRVERAERFVSSLDPVERSIVLTRIVHYRSTRCMTASTRPQSWPLKRLHTSKRSPKPSLPDSTLEYDLPPPSPPHPPHPPFLRRLRVRSRRRRTPSPNYGSSRWQNQLETRATPRSEPLPTWSGALVSANSLPFLRRRTRGARRGKA